jgi:hypothetical protein
MKSSVFCDPKAGTEAIHSHVRPHLPVHAPITVGYDRYLQWLIDE